MFTSLALFLATLALTQAAPMGGSWPNGTDTTNHWWQNPSPIFTIYSLQTTDSNGNPEYPIHLSSPLVAVLNATNTGPAISQLQEDIALAEWDFFFQKWNTLPTFGLLSNLNGCTNGIACPIPKGNQALKVTIDFSKFQAIINLLKNDVPYQLQISLTNKATGDKIVVTAQARAEIH